MTRFRPLAFAAGGLAVAAAVLITAATGSRSAGPSPSARISPELAALAKAPSPVASFLASVGAAPQPTSYELRDRWENKTRDCMAAEGFDYTPVDSRALDAAVASARARFARGAAETMTDYGYGITDAITGTLPSAPVPDPNAEKVAAMNGDQKRAYGAARAQCSSASRAEDPDPDLVVVPSDVNDKIAAAQRAAAADPRMAAADQAWSACVANRGFRFPNPSAVLADLQAKAAPLRAAVQADGGAARVQRALQVALAVLHKREMAIAAADLACKGPRDQAIAAVQHEYEAKLVEQDGGQMAARILLGQGH